MVTPIVDLGSINLTEVVVPDEELRLCLPQDHEFRVIDEIRHIDEEQRIVVGRSEVGAEPWWARGHIPGRPLMPGVLLTETMAQTSGWLLIALLKFERMPFLASVKEAKMRDFVKPGELLTVDASVVHDGSGFAITDAKVSVDGKVKCNATLTFRHTPFPNLELRGHMEAMAKRIGLPQQAAAHG